MRIRRFFSDRRGRLVLFQVPNAPLVLWFTCAVVSRSFGGNVSETADVVGFGALFVWSWLEITDGTTPFRRVLGAGVLIVGVVGRVAG